MNNIVNNAAYLPTSRNFPNDIDKLIIELNRSYIDIANVVNVRTISIFPSNKPAQTGESWFFQKNMKQQGFRQVYPFTGNITAINHMISPFQDASYFTKIYGTFFDGTNWYALPYVDITAVTNQIQLQVNSTQILIHRGAGAPTMVKGIIVLEWITEV